MSVDTRLEISNEWQIEDVVTVIQKYLQGKKIKLRLIKSCPDYQILSFTIKEESYCINIHRNHYSEVGTNTLLTMYSDDKNIYVLRTIGNVFGGIFQKEDYEDKYEMLSSKFDTNNGLSYFLKYAILHNELEGDYDLVGLNKSIHKWCDRVSRSDRNKMQLFSI